MISYRLSGLLSFHVLSIALVGLGWLNAYSVLVRSVPGGIELLPQVQMTAYSLAVVAAVIVSARYLSHISPAYHRFTWIDSVRLTIRQVTLVALFLLCLMFALKDQYISRLFVGSYLLSLWVILVVVNVCLPRVLARLAFLGHHQLPTIFVGSQLALTRLGSWLAARESLGYRAVGFLSDEQLPTEPVSSSVPFLGRIDELKLAIDRLSVAQVIVLAVPRDNGVMRRVIEVCQDTGCRLLIYSNIEEITGHPMVAINESGNQFYALQDEPLENPVNRLVKRAFDLAISVPVVMFLLVPLILLVWLVQRIQAPGRLFFTQKRSGHRNRHFTIYKFRSMYSRPPDGDHEARQARKGDERIYPFGAFLRRTSLDEFPQFINVLFGQMSVVGPRPHLLQHDESFAAYMRGYRTRFLVKPGITGLAQCRGFRGEITDAVLLERRVKNDLEYIGTWSLWLDLQIVIKTAWQIVSPPKSAY